MKKDENKETMLEKAKRKANSAKEKVANFVEEHRAAIYVAGLSAIGVAGSVLLGKRICKLNAKATGLICDIENETLSLMERDSAWREEDYRENWDIVNGVAKALDLKPGESYIIEGPGIVDGHDLIVSHMVDGIGVYPPDEDEKPEVEGE